MLQLTFWIRNITILLFCIIRHLNGFWGVISVWKPRQQTRHSRADLWQMVQAHLSDETLSVTTIFICIFQYYSTLKRKTPQGWARYNKTFDGHHARQNKTFADQAALIHHTNMTFSLCGVEKEAAGAWNLRRLAFFLIYVWIEFRTLRFVMWFKIKGLLYLQCHSITLQNQSTIYTQPQPDESELTNSRNGWQQHLQQHDGWTAGPRRLFLAQTRHLFVFVMSNSWKHLQASILCSEINLSNYEISLGDAG